MSDSIDGTGAVQVIASVVVIQHILSWFRKHDEDATNVIERVFERPDQPEKVRKRS